MFGKNGEHGYVPEGVPGATNAVIVQGKCWTRALSMHPPDRGEASVKYQLDRQYKLLKAQVAFHDLPVEQAGSPQTFKVYSDGQLLWISAPPIQRKTDLHNIHISVENVDTLELRVHCAVSKINAWTVWVNPRVLK